MSEHLSPAEQYGCTTGLCHEFALAARQVVGGVLTLLVATDPRLLVKHDHPLDMPMDVHVFLTLPDGTVVDAEGQRSVTELLRGFGVESGYTHHLVPDPDGSQCQSSFGTASTRWTQALQSRIEDLGWGEEVPQAAQALLKKKDFKAARMAWPAVLAQYRAQMDQPVAEAVSPKP